MRTFSSIKDLPVYETRSGKELGKVLDLYFNDKGTVNGLIMDTKGLFKRNKLIPLSEIASFGLDGVMLASEQKDDSSENGGKKPSYYLQNGHEHILGKPLVTTEGEKLGLVEDVYFREELGTIVGYEVTDGFFADMTEGRKVFKTDKPLTIGDDILIVDVNPLDNKAR